MIRRPIVLSAVLVGCLILPAAASATTRYAAPGGTAADTVCIAPDAPKCSIGAAAGGPDVVDTDEAVILPGNYSDAAGDLDGDDNLNANTVQITAGNVHGAPGAQRPVITLTGLNPTAGAFSIFDGTLSDVEIDTAANRTNLSVFGGTVTRVIARSSSTVSLTTVCTHQGGTITDSACLASGNGATAIGASCSCGAFSTQTLTLRNVTAVSTGSNSFGASYFFGGSAVSWQIGLKSGIVRGTTTDIRAAAKQFSGVCPTAVTITVDHSNFASTAAPNDAGCGSAGSVASGGNNQSTAPSLAADGYHQLTGSPTIDFGEIDGSSGPFDLDGQDRTIGATPDMGADEFGRPTTTEVTCNPNPTVVGTSTTCSATVLGPVGTGVPHGTVEFSSDATGGVFAPSSICTLVVAGENGSDCQVTYMPGTGTGTHHLTAAYDGSTTRDPSSGSTDLGVTPPASTPPPPGQSNTPGVRKKCKKKKKHSASAAKKKKCKKKKRR